MGCRVFAFEGVKPDRTRARYTVGADLRLIRKYGRRVQQLPLLCRGLLDTRGENEQKRALVFSEDDMQLRAKDRELACEAAGMRKSPRRPPGTNAGAAWRVPRLNAAGWESFIKENDVCLYR
jgi:hypothetical protein